jgi:hypothetical protein
MTASPLPAGPCTPPADGPTLAHQRQQFLDGRVCRVAASTTLVADDEGTSSRSRVLQAGSEVTLSPTTVGSTGSLGARFRAPAGGDRRPPGGSASLPWGRLPSLPARPARLVDLNRRQGSAQGQSLTMASDQESRTSGWYRPRPTRLGSRGNWTVAQGATTPVRSASPPSPPGSSGVRPAKWPSAIAGKGCVPDRCAPATHGRSYERTPRLVAFPQVNAGVVGLAGLEPAALTSSAIKVLPSCNPAFPQDAANRRGPSYAS